MNIDQVHHLVSLSEMHPVALYTTPQVPGEAKQRRRRRRKAKTSSDDGAGLKKRKLSEEQASLLERSFGFEHKLESERKDRLASELGLDPKQVAVWFQNRRARWKNKMLEEEYSKLRTQHDAVVLEKCHLETLVLKLKEQLNDAEGEIQRLSERSEMKCIKSPSYSHTVETPMLLGAGSFDTTALYNAMEEHGYVPDIDWTTLYINI